MNGKTAKNKILERQRQQLGRWLTEWRMDSILKKVDAGILSLFELRNAHAYAYPGGRHTEVKAGQIWLLPPSFNATAMRRAVYVLVLEVKNDATCLLCPFSRFSAAATPGEWMTGLKAMPLRILCLWNTRLIGSDLLTSGWCVGSLSKSKMECVHSLWAPLQQEEPFDIGCSKKVGPPIMHPLDPRLKYLEEEADVLEVGLVDGAVVGSGAHRWTREKDDLNLLKAAEAKAEYRAKKKRSRK